MKLKRILVAASAMLSLCAFSLSYANSDKVKTINVLSWFGYLSDPRISQEVIKQCGVNLSVDEYVSNENFIDLFNKNENRYDLVVFSNLMLNSVRSRVENNNSTLYKVAENYYPTIRDYYFSHNYPKNVVFFSHAIMGFMFNPNLIKLSATENLFSIFKAVGDNYAIILDDPAEVENLITLGYRTSGIKWSDSVFSKDGTVKLNYQNVSRVTQNAKVYISNDFNQIYDMKKFAVAFLWSGDAILFAQKSKKPYEFLLNKNVSYVCTDLLAQLNENKETSCVAHVIESKKVMDYISNTTYYFSPYFTNSVKSKKYSKLYNETKKMLPVLPWIEPVKDFSSYSQDWQSVKFELNENKHN
ncbi:hypothetical protein [Cysteiniphilum litorale]|uniref:hypothetical protein n=1 Tax=Cysteiniphilum litorale TaxID=2056700 RepID=UPI003F88179A